MKAKSKIKCHITALKKNKSVIQFDEENIAKFRHYFVDDDLGKKAISIPRISYGDFIYENWEMCMFTSILFFYIPPIS